MRAAAYTPFSATTRSRYIKHAAPQPYRFPAASSANQSSLVICSGAATFTIVDLLCESANISISIRVFVAFNMRPLTGSERFLAVLTSDPALLHPAPRRARVVPVMRVHPHKAGLYACRETMRAREVARPESCAEPVAAVISELYAFVLGLHAL